MFVFQVPIGSRVKWSLEEHVAVHKYFGRYRGDKRVNIQETIRPVLEAFPECSKILGKRNIMSLRDKIRGFFKKP